MNCARSLVSAWKLEKQVEEILPTKADGAQSGVAPTEEAEGSNAEGAKDKS